MWENKVSLSETRPVFYFTSVIFMAYSGSDTALQEKNYMLLTEGWSSNSFSFHCIVCISLRGRWDGPRVCPNFETNLNKTIIYIYASAKISYQFLVPWHLFLRGNKAANSNSSDHPLSNCCLISYSSSLAVELTVFASKNVFNNCLGTYNPYNRLRPRQTKNNAYSKGWRENKEYYVKINGIFEVPFENLFSY